MIIEFNPRQDKFGFYTVGDFKTYSKFEAIELEKKVNVPLKWNFNDEVYSSYDWTVEPAESLEELYRQRAQQLRDEYDHLVLWYSGGADSTNILDTFVKNNIKLDEALSYINYNASDNKEDPTNGEVFHVAIPRIKKIREQQSWPYHRVVDLTKIQVDYFSEKDAKFDWIYGINGYISPHNISKQNIKLHVAEWQALAEQGKRVGHIFGLQKPIVKKIGDEFITHFVDRIDNAVTAESQILNRPWEFNELFYWDPSCPKMVIKQCHIIKNYLKQINPTDMQFDIAIDDEFGRRPEWGPTDVVRDWKNGFIWVTTTDKDSRKYYLTFDAIHRLIYPDWFPVPYQVKITSVPFSHKDYWFFNLDDSNLGKQGWKLGFDKLWESVPKHYKKDVNSTQRGFTTTNSRRYQIGR